MLNILFVDDELNILEGWQRTLRFMRHEWQTLVALGSTEALTILDTQNIDVIVSDMRMPGMDGAELLQVVKAQYPHIVRIALSGYSEKEAILKSIGIAHQYLTKPCEPEILKATISRACALQTLLTNEKLRRLVSQLQTVPSLPAIYNQLMEELQSPNSSLKKIGNLIEQDLGLMVKILQVVNSAFFGLRRQVSDVGEAVNFLGVDTIHSLALAVGIFSQLEGQQKIAHLIANVWGDSTAIGAIAKNIATEECRVIAPDAFTAGLLHDIGEVVLAINLPQEFITVQKLMAEEKTSKLEAEKHVYHTTHSEVGAYLLGLWGLPTPVVEAVAFHHTPSACQSDSFTALTAVYVAETISQTKDDAALILPQPYDVEYLSKLSLLEKLPIWQATYVHFN